MNAVSKRKMTAILSACLNFVTVGVVCFSAAYLMQKTYYGYIFVSGGSMNPTLKGGHDSGARGPYYNPTTNTIVPGDTVHFGTVDESYKAKKNANRFDIVTTYYPWSDYNSDGSLRKNADYKIKRIIAMPGETFKINNGELSVKIDGVFQKIPTSFDVDDGGNVAVKDVEEKTLGDNEYWLLGDHRSNSSDCGTYKKPVYFNNLIGVLISIEGTAEFYYHYHCEDCAHEIDDSDYLSGKIAVCPNCGGSITRGSGDIRNRVYAPVRII